MGNIFFGIFVRKRKNCVCFCALDVDEERERERETILRAVTDVFGNCATNYENIVLLANISSACGENKHFMVRGKSERKHPEIDEREISVE